MTIFGVDISGYQPDFNFARCRAQGFDLAVIKATEASNDLNYINPSYAKQYAAAVAAGLLTVSYVFVHSTNEAKQVALAEQVIPKGSVVVLDAEVDGSGVYPVTVDMVRAFTAAGYHVPFVYLPRWFWSNIGSPSLAGLPGLWSSGYPTSRSGAAVDIYAAAGGDDGSGWAAYGGLTPVLWQFTSAATVANYPAIDCSAFRGSREQLAALLQGDTMTPEELLDLPINRQGSETGATSLRQIVAWFDSDLNGLKGAVGQQIDALRTDVEQRLAAFAAPTIDYDLLAAKIAGHIHLSGNVVAEGDQPPATT